IVVNRGAVGASTGHDHVVSEDAHTIARGGEYRAEWNAAPAQIDSAQVERRHRLRAFANELDPRADHLARSGYMEGRFAWCVIEGEPKLAIGQLLRLKPRRDR